MLKLEPLATVGMGIGIRALGNIPLGVRTNAVACPTGTGMVHASPESKRETVGWTEISRELLSDPDPDPDPDPDIGGPSFAVVLKPFLAIGPKTPTRF